METLRAPSFGTAWLAAASLFFTIACQPESAPPTESEGSAHQKAPLLAPEHFTQGHFEQLEDLTPRQAKEFYALPGLDHGLIQSPVNILSERTIEGKHRIELHAGMGGEEIVNTGHTLELDFPKGTTVKFDGKVFELKQLHFHTPSEHQIDGVTYPMEMHIVNRLVASESSGESKTAKAEAAPRESEKPAASEEAEYLVFGVLFRMGPASEFIGRFLDSAPSHDGEHARVKGERVQIAEVVGPEVSYYHYNGSLTTPPYTETVTWLVGKKPLTASPEQIQKINRLEGNNARHVQATYGRVIDG